MKRLYFRAGVLALTAVVCGTSAAVAAEKWSCDMTMEKGKAYKQEWVVSDNRMFAPKGKGYYRVARNDDEVVLAFLRTYGGPPKNDPASFYVMIAKRSGMAIAVDDVGIYGFGRNPEQWLSPLVETGHCSLEHP